MNPLRCRATSSSATQNNFHLNGVTVFLSDQMQSDPHNTRFPGICTLASLQIFIVRNSKLQSCGIRCYIPEWLLCTVLEECTEFMLKWWLFHVKFQAKGAFCCNAWPYEEALQTSKTSETTCITTQCRFSQYSKLHPYCYVTSNLASHLALTLCYQYYVRINMVIQSISTWYCRQCFIKHRYSLLYHYPKWGAWVGDMYHPQR